MNKLFVTAIAAVALGTSPVFAQPTDILNASYDIARELFEAENAAYAESGATITINQSHAGSSAQARAVLEGLAADVVTFNQVTDIARLVDGGFVSDDWASDFPNNAAPFYSFPAFLVREGNPKGISDWGDLAEEGVQVIIPNPKTSGNGRYTYLAARAWAVEEYAGDEAQIEDFLTRLLNNVPVFETGGRAATTAFTERQLGDVLVTFEAEVLGVQKQLGEDLYDGVIPSVSFLSEFPVAVVDKVVDARGSRDIAKAYLDFLFTPEGQEVAAANFHRPYDETVLAAHAETFQDIRLVTVEDAFGGWDKVAEEHFADGGLLDKVFLNQ
ncbi:MAG: sulfate ABC transporter substrate-binding protein [Candidatus Devosia phytovorans]|uniref:Sulfate ABC transporter substrate-binding protein n=1 Tax=Candidatus Devosia phytovorans TaxID=3121372 RepID=A0AAJ6B1L0_9HYPH|nr:sulfate ABC transporter substrate-binding protein [Devosia sp.]WEK05886.1 MAG: sulfate ABC transporter substrate-binding protein [Devosia sp.]